MGPAESEIEALRRRLRSGETSLLDKYSGRIDAVERVRPVFVIGDALDAMLAAAKMRLVSACGSDPAEYWAITIFAADQINQERALTPL